MDKLSQLKQFTTVVADSGDFNAIKQYLPQDATTNPSLVLKAANQPQYQYLIEEAVSFARARVKEKEKMLTLAAEKLMVNFGCELLKIIPGRVSTEVDATLSFDCEATIASAERIIELYEQQGISREKVLIKIAATWEGIQAAQALEARGIHCNVTLIFSLEQAILCAEAGITLVSPFVGRIYDWFVKHEQRDYQGAEDPGVLSVKNIYNYYKAHQYQTIVMGASFRNTGQIEALAGCDYLTISPALLQQLQAEEGVLARALSPGKAAPVVSVKLDEKYFRLGLTQNAMAYEKLGEGIRLFVNDLAKLKTHFIKG